MKKKLSIVLFSFPRILYDRQLSVCERKRGSKPLSSMLLFLLSLCELFLIKKDSRANIHPHTHTYIFTHVKLIKLKLGEKNTHVWRNDLKPSLIYLSK